MSFEVEYFTLSAIDVTNQYVTLNRTLTDSTNVALDVIGGTAQAILSDFTVSVDNTAILWDNISFGLNGVLATGDQLRVIYDAS